jgi:hypothetical protein
MFVFLCVLMALIPSAFAAAGAMRDELTWLDATIAAAIFGALIMWPLWLAGDDVLSAAGIGFGLVLGPIAVAVAPSLFYFGMGRVLADRHRAVLAAAWLVSLFPVGVYIWYALLITLDRAD